MIPPDREQQYAKLEAECDDLAARVRQLRAIVTDDQGIALPLEHAEQTLTTVANYVASLPVQPTDDRPEGWLAFDIGCIECGEPSAVIGVYANEDDAKKAADEHGQYKSEVFRLPTVSGAAPTDDRPDEAETAEALAHVKQMEARYGRHSLTSCPPVSRAMCSHYTTLKRLAVRATPTDDRVREIEEDDEFWTPGEPEAISPTDSIANGKRWLDALQRIERLTRGDWRTTQINEIARAALRAALSPEEER